MSISMMKTSVIWITWPHRSRTATRSALSLPWPGANMADAADNDNEEIPEGAAVLPSLPAELEVHPLLLAVLHAVVFLGGSTAAVVHPAAAGEALEYLATYLQRLHGPELERVRADLACL